MHTSKRTGSRGGLILAVVGALAAPALAVLGLQTPADAATPVTPVTTGTTGTTAAVQAASSGTPQPVCPGAPTSREANCLALRYPGAAARQAFNAATLPAGYGPSDLQSAYSLPADGGAGQTIAIVDAYDDPAAEADLAVYRQQYGLPACTSANGCFRKADQRGGTSYPVADVEWAGEISLDLDMVSAVAPAAHILLVETDSSSPEDLAAGADEAVALGAKFVSNSYTFPETASDAETAAAYDHPGVAMVAASGDNGYGVNLPAAFRSVTAVGGTTLTRDPDTARGWSETVWQRGIYSPGSGCSSLVPKPSFQNDAGCANRTVADVSAVSDNVAVYQTFGAGTPGWIQFGGTSVATPVIAGVYADAGAPAPDSYPNSYPYAASSAALNDVVSGSNGTCDPSYLCNGAAGFDGPTGLGTPNGLSAFSSGPKGALSGTVTDARTGEPISQATVSSGAYTAKTDAQGHYALQLPVGTDDLTLEAFGYEQSGTTVQITENASTTHSVSLSALPTATVTGKVTDGSGHGWPLYAKVSVESDPGAPVWTDPTTGVYRLSLPKNQKYTLDVSSSLPGYTPAARAVTVGRAATKADVALTADAEAATAPGYALHTAGRTETFDSATAPPNGWSVVNTAGSTGGWVFDDPGSRGNATGGDGAFAVVDSDHLGGGQDTQLISPPYDFSTVGAADLTFDTAFIHQANDTFTVDASTDGGTTWATVWSDPAGRSGSETGETVRAPLAGLAGASDVRLRFHYVASWSYFWSVDDVQVTTRTLTPVPGSLLTGTVTGAATGAGVVGATVADRDDPAVTTRTIATPDDPAIGDGLYSVFSPDLGRRTFTAAGTGYTARAKNVRIGSHALMRASFRIRSER